MSRINVDALHSEDGANSNIELDDSRNTTCKGNLTVDGTTTLTGAVTLPAGTTSDTLSFRNVIINGAMKVSQRGTSQTGITSQGKFRKAPDRFKFSVDDGTWTVSQDSSGPPGFANSYKIDCTTADTSIAAGNEVKLDTKLEGQDLQHFCKGTASAKKFCLQFWVKSNKTGNYAVQMRDQDNTRHVCNLYTISSADTWEQKKIVFPADTTGAFGDDADNSLTINWYLSVGTNKTSGTMDTAWASVTDANIAAGQNVNLADSTSNYLNITGIQLEAADACTEFEHRTYGEDLQKCLRYYWEITGDNYDKPGISTFANNASTCRAQVKFPVPMRAGPAFTGSSTGMMHDSSNDSATFDISDFVLSAGNITTEACPSGCTIEVSTSSMDAGAAGDLEFKENGGIMQFDAEL